MALHRNSPNIFQRSPQSPSSTTASAAATTTNNGNGNDQGLNITGSPPLIVAFLAVGLFMAAMLTIFGWRRVVFGRFLIQPIGGEGFHAPRMAESFYGEKPELWDLWTQSTVGSNERLKWEQIAPLSASIKQSGDDSDEARLAHLRMPSQLQSIQQHIRRHTRAARSADDQKPSAASAQGRKLQVAVAIAMPSPHRHDESTSEGPTSTDPHTHEHHDADPFIYSLGLMEMPWHS